MANEEQLSILRQGVEVWNKWRLSTRNVEIQLGGADLHGKFLVRARLMGADLKGANLKGANLGGAYLWGADLESANLVGAFLSQAHFMYVSSDQAALTEVTPKEIGSIQTSLKNANLSEASFRGANLNFVDLSFANLEKADLGQASIGSSILTGTNFLQAKLGYTIFAKSDLSETVGLEGVIHTGPSDVSPSVFALSKGKIPDVFLRGCGLGDWEIEQTKLYDPNLSNDEINRILYKMYDLRASQALQISPLFISYSHADSKFVDKIGSSLTQKGIRFWRDIHDMKSGRIEKQIDRAIRQNPTVLLVLSEHTLGSDWVEHEVRTARQLEKDMERDVLCPVALDDSWKSGRWPTRVMEQIMEYNILDFSAWEDDVKFEGMFRKLIDGLQLFYKG